MESGLADPEAPAARTDVERRRAMARLGAGFCGLLIGALTAGTALMLWQHQRVSAQHGRDAAIVDAARVGVTAMLSIDHTKARADVQHVLDVTTGNFHDDFASSADDFVRTAQESKAVTKGSVKAAALESRTPGGGADGVVLVAATSEVTNANGARQDPRPFRMSVTVTRDGDRFKMSELEFVP